METEPIKWIITKSSIEGCNKNGDLIYDSVKINDKTFLIEVFSETDLEKPEQIAEFKIKLK